MQAAFPFQFFWWSAKNTILVKPRLTRFTRITFPLFCHDENACYINIELLFDKIVLLLLCPNIMRHFHLKYTGHVTPVCDVWWRTNMTNVIPWHFSNAFLYTSIYSSFRSIWKPTSWEHQKLLATLKGFSKCGLFVWDVFTVIFRFWAIWSGANTCALACCVSSHVLCMFICVAHTHGPVCILILGD